MKSISSFFLLFMVCHLCLSQTYLGNKEDIAQILENAKNFSSYVVAGDYDHIVASYTDDAKIFPNNREILEGKAAILKYWTLPEGVQTTHHKLMPSEIKIIGNEAYDYGYYEGRTKRANGQESSWKGKYVVVWRKEAGNWKMYLDIWNTVK